MKPAPFITAAAAAAAAAAASASCAPFRARIITRRHVVGSDISICRKYRYAVFGIDISYCIVSSKYIDFFETWRYLLYIAIFYSKRLYFYYRIIKITTINEVKKVTSKLTKANNNIVSTLTTVFS